MRSECLVDGKGRSCVTRRTQKQPYTVNDERLIRVCVGGADGAAALRHKSSMRTSSAAVGALPIEETDKSKGEWDANGLQ